MNQPLLTEFPSQEGHPDLILGIAATFAEAQNGVAKSLLDGTKAIMELTEKETRQIERAARRLRRWPATRGVLLVVSFAAINSCLFGFSVAVRTERPEPQLDDRFMFFGWALLSLVVASLCISKIICNWKGSAADRLIVKLAEGRQDK